MKHAAWLHHGGESRFQTVCLIVRMPPCRLSPHIIYRCRLLYIITAILSKTYNRHWKEHTSNNKNMEGKEHKLTGDGFKKALSLFVKELNRYFNVSTDREKEEDTVDAIRKGVSFHGSNLWILVFAIFIASLGLNVNSTAVIIGAMLISPLMGPIIGMGLAVGINDFELLKRSVKNYLVATLISVVTATVYFLLTPLNEAQSELLARTSPTLYDVLIALCGGAAGIVALSCKGKGNVFPGVAIATALMPPLCTAGFGIATGNIYYFLGAFYLFFINTVFISLATYLGVRMMKFRQKQFINHEQYAKVKRYIVIAVVVTMVPAAFMTYGIVRSSIFKTNVSRFVKDRLENNGTRIISYDVNKDSLTLRVVAVGKEISDSMIKRAERSMSDYKMAHYTLNVIQGSQSDSVMLLNSRLSSVRTTSDNYAAMLREEALKASSLQDRLNEYTRYDELAPAVAAEMRTLFPAVRDVSLSLSSTVTADTTAAVRRPIALVGIGAGSRLSSAEHGKMKKWLAKRVGADNIELVTHTAGK